MGFGDSPFGLGGFGLDPVLLTLDSGWTLRQRSGALTPGKVYTDWTGTLVERTNLPDTLQVEGPLERLRDLLVPGSGVTLEDGVGTRFSGPLTEFTKRGDGTCTATFASDLIWLWGRICYPTPAAVWQSQSADYDTRTGAAETVLLAFVNANVGPGALAARQRPGLTLPTTLGRGGTVTITARFDNVGQLVRDIAEAAGLRVTVLQAGASLVLAVDQPADLSAWARYGTGDAGGPGILSEEWEYTVKAPELTRALVGGGGEGAARILRERASTPVESLWGNRSEVFVDQRNTSDTAELDKAGDDEIADGAEPVQIRATVPDVEGMRLVSNVPVGSLVGLDLDGDFIVDRLRQVTTEIAADGTTISGVVGSSDAGLTRDQTAFLKLRKALRKVQAR